MTERSERYWHDAYLQQKALTDAQVKLKNMFAGRLKQARDQVVALEKVVEEGASETIKAQEETKRAMKIIRAKSAEIDLLREQLHKRMG